MDSIECPDGQGHWWSQLSVVSNKTNDYQTTRIEQKKKKCHGNRKLQRFRRKCRLLQMKLLIPDTDNDHKRKRSNTTQESTKDFNLHKSFSQLSVSQPDKKRRKHDDKIDLKKCSKYLRMPKKILLHSLRLQLQQSLNNRRLKRFILQRLYSFDQQYILDCHLRMYRLYLQSGLSNRMWPTCIILKLGSDRLNQSEKYIRDQINEFQICYDQLLIDIDEQTKSFSMMNVSLDEIDKCLRNYVELHHLDLKRTINYQINRFQDEIQEKIIFNRLFSYRFDDDQLKSIQYLIDFRHQQLKSFESMIMFETRLFTNRWSKFDIDQMQVWLVDDKIKLDNKKQIEVYQHNRISFIQRLTQFENDIQDIEFQYQSELFRFENVLCHPSLESKYIIETLLTYLECRIKMMIREIRYQATRFLQKLKHPKHCSSNQISIGIYSRLIIEQSNIDLNKNELNFLTTKICPNYIRSNQSFLQRSKQIDKKINLDLEIMNQRITNYLQYNHQIPCRTPIVQELLKNIRKLFEERHHSSLSYNEQFDSKRNLKLLCSIQRKLQKYQSIICINDKSNVFYISSTKFYEQNILNYHQKQTLIYIELSSNPLQESIHRIVQLLNELRSKQFITQWQYNRMIPNRETTCLPHQYFIPRLDQSELIFRSMISYRHAPTMFISKMLDELIRPLFDRHLSQTTIIDGVHLIRRLNKYIDLNLLKPTTYFCTITIKDLYDMLPQEESIVILRKFLVEHGHSHVCGISIDTIERLVRLILNETIFTCQNKYYRQIVGSAIGSPFTMTLMNIFIWNWEQDLIGYQKHTHEFYGRHFDQIFLTTNGSILMLEELIRMVLRKNSNVHLTSNISQKISFLDVHIENLNSQLITSVNQDESSQINIVSFRSDHPRQTFTNIIRRLLSRALKYSSTLDNFNNECRSIKVLLLYNEYPSRFIHVEFNKFLRSHNIMSMSIIPIIHDENEFHMIRSRLIHLPTIVEHGRANRIARYLKRTQNTIEDDQLVLDRLVQLQKQQNKLIIHYTYERRFQKYKSILHHLWNVCFNETTIGQHRLIVGTRNNRNLKRELTKHFKQNK